jgi:RNA recognition motif-containing protein
VFIGNLAWDMTQEMAEEMLNDVLGPQSYSRVRLATDRCSIYSLYVYIIQFINVCGAPYRETGRPRGFGHIDFKDAATAERAITELNGLEVLHTVIHEHLAVVLKFIFVTTY